MSASNDGNRKRPMAEPATQTSGNEVGGMRAGADHGFSDATQRSMEHADTSPLGRASTGDASGNADPRLDLGGTNAPGAAATPSSAADRPAADDRARTPAGAARAAGRTAVDSDDEDEWRHEPVAPVDERNPLKSLGRAVADVATGGAEDTAQDTSKPRGR